MNCPNCKSENPVAARFCLQCGAPLLQICSSCQAELPAGARFCMFCGQAVRLSTQEDALRLSRLAATTPAPLAEKVLTTRIRPGERRMVTVLLVDVVGSTGLSEKLGVEAWTGIMNSFLEIVTPVVYRYEGTLARLVGDALVAFFGAPVAHEDDPVRAVRAALDVQREARIFSANIEKQHQVTFAIRVCLNRGPVVIDSVDRDLKYDFTPVGGVVNLATRLKFAALPNTVVLSDDVYHLVAPLFDVQYQGQVEVKGQSQPVPIYQVLAMKSTPGSLRGLVGLESPMVGRQTELATLIQLHEAVRAGLGRAVLLMGEPGLGKSRLIAEWQAAIAKTSRASSQWAEGHCLSYGKTLAYHLVQDLLRSLLGIAETECEPDTHAALRSLIQDLFEDVESTSALDVYPYLGNLLSVNLQGAALERVQRLDPQALQAQYLLALRKLLARLAERRSLVLVIEDLHWADPSSVEILAKLLPIARTSPVLFCLVLRPERDSPGWRLVSAARETMGAGITEISLETLSEIETRTLVSNLLEIEALPEETRTLILEKSEGNPFFVEEVIRMLIDQKAIVPNNGGWVAGEGLKEVIIPDNLQGLLLARIDRLSEEGRYTLRVASVVGRQFPVRVLNQVMGTGAHSGSGAAMGSLNSLESAGLVRIARVEPELEYLFRHALVQQAAYASLLVADRKRLHLAVGEAIEQLYPNRLEDYSAMLARHYDEAGEAAHALDYYILAGEAALNNYANIEAGTYHQRALELTTDERQRAELLTGMGEALYRQGHYEQAIQTWQQGIDQYRQLGDPDGESRLYARSGRAAWMMGDRPHSLAICRQGLAAVSGAPESPDLARLLHETARAYFFNGNPEQATALSQQALTMAERLGAVDVQADTLATIGVIEGQPPEVILAALEKAVELAETYSLYQIGVRAHHNLGNQIRSIKSDSAAGKQHFQRAIELARMRGVVQEEVFSMISLVSLDLQEGNLDAALEALGTMEQLMNMIPDPQPIRAEARVLWGVYHEIMGNWDQALSVYRESADWGRRHGDLEKILNANLEIANVFLEIDRWSQGRGFEEAEASVVEALDIARRGIGFLGWAQAMQVMVSVHQGQLTEAHSLMDQLLSNAENQKYPWFKEALEAAKMELFVSERNWSEAIRSAENIVNYENTTGNRLGKARFTMVLAELLMRSEQPENLTRAQALFQLSMDLFEEIGSTGYFQICNERLKIALEKTQNQLLSTRYAYHELEEARKAQVSFLPEELPQVPGWSLAAVLQPVRETSGDYYDLIPIEGNRLAVVIADVTDKGAAAAFFMASSRTLIRTFADQYPDQPERVIAAVNRRLLMDTHAGLFVTVFYGVLDPQTGMLIYCNAGHNPPYLFKNRNAQLAIPLRASGMTLGITEDTTWQQGMVIIDPGELLVLYTDGLTDGETRNGVFFGDQGLISAVHSLTEAVPSTPLKAVQVQEHILSRFQAFLDGSPRSDDLTLLVLLRN